MCNATWATPSRLPTAFLHIALATPPVTAVSSVHDAHDHAEHAMSRRDAESNIRFKWCALHPTCRYGLLNKAAYPNWHVAALATANPAFKTATQGCGYGSGLVMEVDQGSMHRDARVRRDVCLHSACTRQARAHPCNMRQHIFRVSTAAISTPTRVHVLMLPLRRSCSVQLLISLPFTGSILGMKYERALRNCLPCGHRTCWKFTCSASNPKGVCLSTTKSINVLITDCCPECKSKNNADFDTQVGSML